jgi:hypothetical protein
MITFSCRFFQVWVDKQCFFDPHPPLFADRPINGDFSLYDIWPIVLIYIPLERAWKAASDKRFDRNSMLENCISHSLYVGNSYQNNV